MGEIQIRFRMNMETGKKDILIEYDGDEDAMRHEHEREHRRIVETLVGKGVLREDEVGDVQVKRGSDATEERREQTGSGPEAVSTQS
ncbi:MAG: hypothetical protein R3F62_06490 [Planctomycetota bacterium]